MFSTEQTIYPILNLFFLENKSTSQMHISKLFIFFFHQKVLFDIFSVKKVLLLLKQFGRVEGIEQRKRMTLHREPVAAVMPQILQQQNAFQEAMIKQQQQFQENLMKNFGVNKAKFENLREL